MESSNRYSNLKENKSFMGKYQQNFNITIARKVNIPNGQYNHK